MSANFLRIIITFLYKLGDISYLKLTYGTFVCVLASSVPCSFERIYVDFERIMKVVMKKLMELFNLNVRAPSRGK